MSEKIYFTRRGLAKIRREISTLTKKLEQIQSQSAYAAEVGGNQYHDNSSYEMLVVDLRGIDRLLTNAYHLLNHAVIIDLANNSEQVRIGTRVRIMKNGEEMIWEIAGFGESDPDRRLLAYNTPIASLIIGKRKGDFVTGVIAGRQVEIEVIDILMGEVNENTE